MLSIVCLAMLGGIVGAPWWYWVTYGILVGLGLMINVYKAAKED